MLSIEVAYVGDFGQALLRCDVSEGITVREAFVQAGLEQHVKGLTVEAAKTMPLGIFSRPVRDPDTEVVREGDRIEGYRPITCDPKQMRRQRAAGHVAKT